MSIKNRHIILLLAIYAFCIFNMAGDLHIPFEFRSVTESSGIPLSGITSLTTDDDGFIWGASRMGMMRVTPTDCRLFEIPVSTSDVMQVKTSYNKGVLVASSQNGQVFRFDPVKSKFEQWFSLTPSLGSKDWVTNLVADDKGRAWVSTSNGIFLHDRERLQRLVNANKGYSYVVPLPDGDMFAIINKSIYIIDKDDLSSRKLEGRFEPFISSGAYDPYNQRIWLGTYQGELWHYSLIDQKFEKLKDNRLPGFIVRSILLADKETLLAGYEGGGILIIDPATGGVKDEVKENIDNPQSLKGNSVSAMLIDGQHRLWTATTNGGLQFTESDRKIIEHAAHVIGDPASLPNNNVNGLMVDREGSLWVATNDGISRRASGSKQWHNILNGNQLSVLSLTQGKDGKIYASTFGDGIYVLDDKTGAILERFTGKDAGIFAPGSFVFASFTDSDGDIWFGGVKGDIVCYSPKSGTFQKYDQHPVFCFAELEPGKILTGGGDGLIMCDKRSGKAETVLPDNVVEDIFVEGDAVWVCTVGNGVIRRNLKTGEETSITTKEGLHSNYTCSLIRTGENLWISTLQGMSCYNLKENKMVTLPGRELLTRTTFRENASSLLPDGRLAFGTNDGLVIFDPDTLANAGIKGEIYFSDIRVSGQSIRDDESYRLDVPIDELTQLNLDYPRNSFTLSVLPLGNVGSNVGYSWKMEGQDKGWSEISPLPYINYVNLQPGNYTLHVRMYDGGIVSERSIKISVRPPFWKTGWFRGIIVLLAIVVATLGVRLYILKMRQRYTYEKIRFFTRMAHDLRTSLMLIKAPLDELRKEEEISDWGTKCRDLAADQADRLCDTVTQLLDFEKADIGAEQPNFTATDLAALFKKRIATYEQFASMKKIDIESHITPGEYITEADPRMMERLIDNLLSNAVKYSKPGSKVEVSFKGEEKEWKLRVKDNGIGIAKSEQRKLFREFYRGENAVNSQIIGSGMGLLTVKKYVDIHKGDIVLESQPGAGTIFEVTVPRIEAETAVIEANEPDVDDTPAETEGAGMHILIVEDNAPLREFLANALQPQFRVTTASDGEEAWKMIEPLQPDLVLSDVMMPRMDGFELCRLIKSTFATSHIPVILLTALPDKSDQMRGLGLGADNYLVKPFDTDLLASRISSIIMNRRNVASKAISADTDREETTIVENGINDEFLKRAVESVKENLANENFGKGEFASAMMISQSLLYKKIKSLTDMSVVEFIRSIRLNHAKMLLESGKNNVTEVSEMCGFSSSAYFSRVFKEHFGKTPSEVMSPTQGMTTPERN